MKKKDPISQEEINKAVSQFLAKGGEIEVIPPVKSKDSTQVYPEGYLHEIEGEHDLSFGL